MLNITYVLPEIFLSLSLMLLLMIGIFVKKFTNLKLFFTKIPIIKRDIIENDKNNSGNI